MKLVTLFVLLFATPVVLAAGSASAAGKLDSAAPLLCVPTTVWECGLDGDCTRGTARSENLPEYFAIDIKAKTLHAEEKGRESTIERVNSVGDRTVLYGQDGISPWVVMINLQTGNLTASVTGDEESFVINGICLQR
jgi:hypothetical protein